MKLFTKVVTPDRIVWEGEVENLEIPATTGLLGIRPNHAPLNAALGIGIVKLVEMGTYKYLVVLDGFAIVANNRVTLLCSVAEDATAIDVSKVQDELAKASLTASQAVTAQEKVEASVEVRKAKARLRAVSYLE
jgi:F-type H+-transporting ATPase subunit epsilon